MIDVILSCLAFNLYFEARSEPVEGQMAVAEVTIRRASLSGRNICEEVFLDRQFSWTSTIERPKITNNKVWLEILSVASSSLRSPTAFAKGATHYHTILRPNRFRGTWPPKWAKNLCPVTEIGAHVFYKECDQ